jgi:deoxyhypusine synthase
MVHHDPVEQVRIRPGMTAGELVRAMGRAGAFNGGALARACDIYEAMLRDKEATRFFGLAGAMVPAGMGGIVEDLIDRGHIDVLVSTGANLVHDIIEALGCHHVHGTAVCSDVDLRRQEINRIYDVFLADDAFNRLEEFLQGFFAELPGEKPLTISWLLAQVGSRLDRGILATAARRKVPVYCPAIQDSVLGLQFWLYSQNRPLVVDAFGDMKALIDRCFAIGRAGAMLVGGGVPKNYILQGMLLTPRGFTWAVQLTGDRPDLGGLSGATLDEARSWGKLTEEAQAVTVYGDATITLPLVVAAVLERMEHG